MLDVILAVLAGALIVGVLVWWRLTVRASQPPAPARQARLGGDLGMRMRSLLLRFGQPDVWDAMEALLITADVGPTTAAEVVAEVRRHGPKDAGEAHRALKDALVGRLLAEDRRLRTGGAPAIYLVVGVNGVGKTTSIAKLARSLQTSGRTVLLGAADTYRAGASEQLAVWGERLGADVIVGAVGSDPAAVAFDSLQAAKARGVDALIVDTAGRLHANRNLMGELEKIARVLRREGGELTEALLVLDATVGQNGIAQARSFAQAVGVTGVVLAKLDGTAKGGVVIPIEDELKVPVKLIGVGESLDDLLAFDPEEYVGQLVDTNG